jgi:hypothetical protein
MQNLKLRSQTSFDRKLAQLSVLFTLNLKERRTNCNLNGQRFTLNSKQKVGMQASSHFCANKLISQA